MITDKIKALFQFIEYLHSNIENFNRYNGLIKELETLKGKVNKLKFKQNYKDKREYDKVQTEFESKFKTLQDNTANLIKAKARELNVCNFENEPLYNFNGIETDIHQLKKNFSDKDLPEIFKHKKQYIEYRKQTHGSFLSLQLFFYKLDEISKSLFDYFKDTEQNEFEPFEAKVFKSKAIPALPPQQTEKPKPVKYRAAEYALTYIFDLYAKDKKVPTNRVEGGFNAKQIKRDSALFRSYDKTPDWFYREVKRVLSYDLNKLSDLENISKNWYSAVKSLSNNWLLTEQYLKGKNLIGE